MTVNTTIVYHATPDATFDMNYYLTHHWPLVNKHWKSLGMQNWKVVEFKPGPDGSKPPYSVAAVITWADYEGVKKALDGEPGRIVMGDIKNFSNKEPLFWWGDIVGGSS